MRHILYYTFATALALTLPACGNNNDHELDHHHSHEAHAHAEHEHEGEAEENDSEITLEPEVAARFGVESDTIYPGDFNETIKATGQIIDDPSQITVVTAPTSGIVKYASGISLGQHVGNGTTIANINAAAITGGDRNKADKATLEAAKRELDRLTPLYEEGIVSQKDYNAAVEAYEVAKSLYSPTASNGVARSVGSGIITDLMVNNGQYVEAGTPIATVSSNVRMTLRADVPDRYIRSIPVIKSAIFQAPYSDEAIDLSAHNGKRISPSAVSTRSEAGYIPVYFTFDNDGQLISRSVGDVYLISGIRTDVISVPIEAVIEQQGHHFVFKQLDEDCYEKIPVTLGASDGKRVEIKTGLQGGECIVTKGAIAVKLAESSGAVPEGHSHNH